MEEVVRNKITVFDGTNFNNWKFRLRVLLDERDYLQFVDKSLTELLGAVTEATAISALKLKEKKCKSLIIQCIADSHLEYIKEKQFAKEVYDVLTTTFERKSTASQLYLRKKLLTLKCVEGENLENHFLTFDKIVRELKSTGANLEDNDVVCHLLLTLPKSFDNVVTALETLEPKKLSIETVKARLLDENNKRIGSGCDSGAGASDGVAMPANARKPYKVKCYKCGKIGHRKFECTQRSSAGDSSKRQANLSKGGDLAFVARSVDYLEAPLVAVERKLAANASANNSCTSSIMTWFIDSGATDHMANDLKFFHDVRELNQPVQIAVAKTGVKLLATKIGTMKGAIVYEDNEVECSITNVLYVKDLNFNLFSIKKCEELNNTIIFENGTVRIMRGNDVLVRGKRVGQLYELKFRYINEKTAALSQATVDINLWHRRLGHLNKSDLLKLINKQMVCGINNLNNKDLNFCEPCVEGKQHRLSFSEVTESRTKRPLELIHSDVCGPITPTAYNNNRYVVSFIDDFTHFAVIYLIKSKDEVLDKFIEFAEMSSTHFEKRISCLRSDNGTEYTSNAFKKYCREKGIRQKYTVPYTPQQNGVAERFNRTIIEKARTMILEAKLQKRFWSEAVLAATYIVNRCPTRALKEGRDSSTPAELWYGKKPDISNLRVFGCTAYAHIAKELRKKLDSKTTKCVMMGYATSGYRLWDATKHKIIVARDVIFNEMWNREAVVDASNGSDSEIQCDQNVLDDLELKVSAKPESNEHGSDDDDFQDVIDLEEDSDDQDRETARKSLPLKQRLRKQQLSSQSNVAFALNAESFVEDLPKSIAEASKRSDWSLWEAAIKDEMDSLKQNRTWSAAKLPESRRPIDCKWIFKIKRNENGNIDRYKARLVARGFQQQSGFDYNETYAPVAKLTTLRIILAVANQHNLHVHQMDVKCAFLNGDLKEDIFMKLPAGFNKEDKIVKLNKSLYGLKQASRAWNERFHLYVVQLGFTRTNADYCLYVRVRNGCHMYLLLYVDDLILACGDLNQLQIIKNQFKKEFEMKDMSELKYYLGIKIERDHKSGVLKLSQKHYLQNVLRRFGMLECNGTATPMEVGLQMCVSDCKADANECNEPYRQLIGCLMYAMLGSRPDLCASISYFSRYQCNPTAEQYSYLKRVLRYVKSTIDLKLIYKRNDDTDIVRGYADADWASDTSDRKSITGYVFMVYGSTVSWLSRKQPTVSLSSTESEYIALSTAACEAIWISALLNELNINSKSTVIYEDNQACIKIAEEPREHKRMKHIDIKYNFIREVIRNGKIKIVYIPTADQLADMMTKALPRVKFEYLKSKIGCLIEEE